jgi:GrpB-like predicted nucleotidyltransferase (UPF0157 family)
MTSEGSTKVTTEGEMAAYTVGELPPLNSAILIVDYDPMWPTVFQRESLRIWQALGNAIIRLEHVGSTSVPGLAAKSPIDIVLAVRDSSDESSYLPNLEAAGYLLRIREPNWYEHRVFNSHDTDLNLHVFSAGCEEIDRMIAFRDWLRTNPADRALYEHTKRFWPHVSGSTCRTTPTRRQPSPSRSSTAR